METSTMESVLLNPLILQNILKYLDVKSLIQCRCICQFWNKETLRILSKKVFFKLEQVPHEFKLTCKDGPTVPAYNEDYNEECSRYIQINNYFLERILLGGLGKSKNPNLLFKDLRISNFRHELRQVYLESLLTSYGKHLESLTMENWPNDMELISSSLNSWCPKLKHLELENTGQSEVSEFEIETQLNLESFTLLEYRDLPSFVDTQYFVFGNSSRDPPPVADWVFKILNASPRLKKLNLSATSELSSYVANLPSIYSALNLIPSISNTLREFHCELFLEYHSEYDNLVQFLRSLHNLERLSFRVVTRYVGNHLPVKSTFDGMKNTLKWLRCSGVFHSTCESDGMLDCIGWFPNLEFFCHEDSWQDRSMENIPFMGLKKPHQNLRKLLLLHVGYETADIKSVNSLVNSFPNLQYLHMDLNNKVFYDAPLFSQLKFNECLEILNKLTQLQDLNILTYFGDISEFTEGMACIQNYKGLKHLTIGQLDCIGIPKHLPSKAAKAKSNAYANSTPSVVSLDDLSTVLLGLSNLNFIRFIGLAVDDEHKALDFATSHDIPLNFGKWEDFRRMRPSWYESYLDSEAQIFH